MKLRNPNHNTAALTLVEVIVVVAALAVLAAMLLPALAKSKRGGRFHCVNQLKQTGLSYHIWSGDNGGKYPMEMSATNGGAMELISTANVAALFQVMSNELSTPRVLHCPVDTEHSSATNFGPYFSSKNISYFVGLNANVNLPNSILGGDNNLERGGNAIKTGVYDVTTNSLFFWSATRHNRAGNVLLANGSVQTLSNSNLLTQFSQTGLATNRLAIP